MKHVEKVQLVRLNRTIVLSVWFIRRKCLSSIISVQFSSVQLLDQLGRREDKKDNTAEILFQSILGEAMVSGSDMGRDGHSSTLSV